MSQILIIEDEPRISSFVAKGLRAAGLTSSIAETGHDGFSQAIEGDHELIILDLGLPDEDGFSVLRRLRAAQIDTPVIILTARGSVEDTVAGLQNGADDYMAKPFHFDELLARVRLRLRSEDNAPEVSSLTHENLHMDLLRRRVTVDECEVDLSAREFALAEAFLRNPGQVLIQVAAIAAAIVYSGGMSFVLLKVIGLVTPPYGLLLFMMMKIANVRMGPLLRETWPFLAVMVGALALVTAWPAFVLALPRLAGYTG